MDEGAEKALLYKGKSLLPAGIVAVEGVFTSGDVVEIRNQAGELIAKGEVNYSASELQKVKGMSTDQAKKLIHRNVSEVVHRDDMIVLKSLKKERT